MPERLDKMCVELPNQRLPLGVGPPCSCILQLQISFQEEEDGDSGGEAGGSGTEVGEKYESKLAEARRGQNEAGDSRAETGDEAG